MTNIIDEKIEAYIDALIQLNIFEKSTKGVYLTHETKKELSEEIGRTSIKIRKACGLLGNGVVGVIDMALLVFIDSKRVNRYLHQDEVIPLYYALEFYLKQTGYYAELEDMLKTSVGR